MKLAIAIIACLALTASVQAKGLLRQSAIFAEMTASPPDDCVWLYQHGNYGGYKDQICLGSNVNSIGSTFGHNDRYSSIKVGADVKAKLYKHNNYNNLVKTTSSNIAKFGPIGINDMISSVKIELENPTNEKYCVRLYQNGNYGGYNDRVCYGNDVAKVGNTFPGHNNNYSSIKVGSEVKAKLYKEDNYLGWLKTASSNIAKFGPIGINDMISSVKVELK